MGNEDNKSEERNYMGMRMVVSHELPVRTDGVISGREFDRLYAVDSHNRGIIDSYLDGRGND